MIALAIDPGITTGFALGRIENGRMFVSVDQAQFKCLGLWWVLHRFNPEHVICETFEFRQGKQRGNLELYSRNLIGVIQLYHEMGGCNLYMQMAAQGKDFWTNDKLKEHGIYVRGKDHGRDAIRHLMYWWTFGAGFQFNKKGHRLESVAFL